MRCACPSLALIVVAACGRVPVPRPAAPDTAPCRLLAVDSVPDTLIVGVPEPVDLALAPVPSTEAERFVFGALYETLVRLDCNGRLEPGLAAQWTRVEDDGRRWRFTLRDDARFWDGTPVTADDVRAAWAGRVEVPAESVTALDARTLSVLLARPDTGAPRLFANPLLAVAKPGAPGAPLGTGPYRVKTWTPGRVDAQAAGWGRLALTFRLAAGADPRDLLDQGADLVVTDDPEVVRYASGRGFEVVPLPWAWTYVLAGELLIQTFDNPDPWGLRDAVRGDVRPAEPPFWWTRIARCRATDRASRPPGTARTLVYVETDPIARDVAQRLAAVWPDSVRAVGRPPAAFADELRANRALGFVAALPRRSYAACVDLPAGMVVPLLDARSWVIARKGRAGVEVDWDGAPRLIRP